MLKSAATKLLQKAFSCSCSCWIDFFFCRFALSKRGETYKRYIKKFDGFYLNIYLVFFGWVDDYQNKMKQKKIWKKGTDSFSVSTFRVLEILCIRFNLFDLKTEIGKIIISNWFLIVNRRFLKGCQNKNLRNQFPLLKMEKSFCNLNNSF